jgi:hypothetical protein
VIGLWFGLGLGLWLGQGLGYNGYSLELQVTLGLDIEVGLG